MQISLVQLMIREFTGIYTAELLRYHGQFLRRHGLCRVASLEAKAGAEACLTQTHTHGHKLGRQAFIFSRSSSTNHSKQCLINEQALLTNVCKKTWVNEERKQNKQEEKREKQSFTMKIRHTCVLLWGQTHVYFAGPSLIGWEMGMILGVQWGPHKFSSRIQCSNSTYFFYTTIKNI